MLRSLPILLLLICALHSLAQKKKRQSATTNFTISQLSKGVWAAIQNDQYGQAICNAAIIDLGDKTIVFDPFMNPQAAQELKETAEELTGKPVTMVINSHYHNDHIRGNQVFSPTATIISTDYTRNRIAEVEPEEQKWERQHAAGLLKATRQVYNSAVGIDKEELPIWIGYYEGMVQSMDDLKIILPDIIFKDSLWILGSERDVKLVEFKDGHTASDIVLYIPSEKIAFLGDLLFVRRHPWLADGDAGHWQKSLDKLYNDQFIQTYVPGHGPVCGKKEVKELYEYLGTMLDLAEAAADDSLKSSALMQTIPFKYEGWYFKRFHQSNMKCLLNAVKRKRMTSTPVPQ